MKKNPWWDIKTEDNALRLLEEWYGMCPDEKECKHCEAVRFLREKYTVRKNGEGGSTGTDGVSNTVEISSAV